MISLRPSVRAAKKWMAEFVWEDSDRPRRVVTHFGASGYDDFTTHGDPERKKRYLARTASQDVSDPTSAATLARFILWNQPTIAESLRDYKKKYSVL